ncbi:MAG: exosortase-associated EpsI family protein [Planctomycetota bacterium]|jgi:hypothetical protein
MRQGIALLPAIAWLALVAGGALSLLCNSGWVNPSQVPELHDIHAEMGPLKANYTIDVDPGILGDLPPEAFLFQSLAGPDGQEGRLYIAYYTRGRRWSGRPHDVDVCYRSMGYQELSAHQIETPSGSILWSRVFERGDETKRVVHWLQKPGRAPGPESVWDLLWLLGSPSGLRQDIASIYLEFDLETAPSETDLADAAQALIEEVETLWH